MSLTPTMKSLFWSLADPSQWSKIHFTYITYITPSLLLVCLYRKFLDTYYFRIFSNWFVDASIFAKQTDACYTDTNFNVDWVLGSGHRPRPNPRSLYHLPRLRHDFAYVTMVSPRQSVITRVYIENWWWWWTILSFLRVLQFHALWLSMIFMSCIFRSCIFSAPVVNYCKSCFTAISEII